MDFTRALMKEFDKTLTVLEENIQKKSHENEEDRGRHRRGKPESKKRTMEADDEPPVKRTSRVSSYYGPVSDEDDEEDPMDSFVYIRSASPDYNEFKDRDIQQEGMEAMLNLSKAPNRTGSPRSRPSDPIRNRPDYMNKSIMEDLRKHSQNPTSHPGGIPANEDV